MKHLLNEEVIKMQQLAGIVDKDETYQDIINEFLQTIDEHNLLTEEEKMLEESLWEKAKFYLSKLGRYKANGKIFGKGKIDAEAEEKIKKILEKEGSEKIKVILDKIKDYAPDFPNNEESMKFLKTCLEIAKTYDGIVAATKKSPGSDGYMPIDAANVLITDLREIVKDFLDRKLTAAYSVFNEAEGDEIGDTDNYDKNAAKAKLARRAGEQEFDSERMKTLKSNKLPLTLLSLGAAAGGLGWVWKMLSEEGTTVYEWVKDIQTLGDVQDGEGFTQILNRTMGANLSPDSPASEVAAKIKEIGDGDFNKGVEMLTKEDGIFRDPEEAKSALSLLGNSDSFNEKESLKDFFKGNLAGTGKSPFDMLVTKPGGVLAKMALRQAVKKTATTAAMAPLAKVLGILGVAGAAAVKIARYKGQKSSRSKVLNDLYQSLKNIKPTEENPSIVKPEGTPDVPTNTEKPADQNAPAVDTKPKSIDIKTVNKDFNTSTSVKTALSKIDTADELKGLILLMSQFVSANLKKDKTNLKSALYAVANKLRAKNKKAAVQEDYTLPADSERFQKALEAAKTLVNDLQKVNTREEFVELLFSILPFIDPEGKITADRQKLVNVIYGVANTIDKYVDERDKDPSKKPGGLS